LELHPYRVVAEQDPQTSRLVLRLRVGAHPPDVFAVLVGDAVGSLRKALNYCAVHLVKAGGGKVNTHSEFPIFNKPWTSPLEASFAGKVKGMPSGAIDLIKRNQPNSWKELSHFHPLYYIHALALDERHNDLPLVAHLVRVNGFGLSGESVHIEHMSTAGMQTVLGAMDDGAAIPGISLGPGTSPDVNMDAQFAFDVAFPQSQVGHGQPVLPTLRRLSEYTRSTLLALGEFI